MISTATSATKISARLIERVLQLSDQVSHVLDAHRKAHQGVAAAKPGASVLGKRSVRHDRRMLDQALHAAEAFGKRKQPAALEEAARGAKAALQHCRYHAAVAPVHLLCREEVLRMARQAGIKDALDLGVLLQPRGDMHGIAAMALHAKGERLDSAQGKKSIEWARHPADGVLQEGELFPELVVFADDRCAAHH